MSKNIIKKKSPERQKNARQCKVMIKTKQSNAKQSNEKQRKAKQCKAKSMSSSAQSEKSKMLKKIQNVS